MLQSNLLYGFALAGVSLVLLIAPSRAQVIPDASLPLPSNVTLEVDATGLEADRLRIEGGTIAGSNLFHSFDRFDLPSNTIAEFITLPTDVSLDASLSSITNIIARITGGQISTIDGTLSADRAVNLFFIAPAGMIFGENARLDLGGSVYASTADALTFADGTRFEANAAAPPLLTVSAPIGFAFDALESAGDLSREFGAIVARSQGLNPDRNDGFGELPGLQVSPGQTLALIGRQIDLVGSELQARGGQIALVGIHDGHVRLSSSGTIEPPTEIRQGGNITLNNNATLNVRAGNDGAIAIAAQDLSLTGGSRLRAGIESDFGNPMAVSGDVTIQANTIRLNETSFISNAVNSRAIGTAGDVILNADQITVAEDSFISADTFGEGFAGAVVITADRVEVVDDGTIRGILFPGAIGRGGSLRLTADQLVLDRGGWLSTTTGGTGNAGDMFIQTESTDILGESDFRFSGLFSSVDAAGIGNGGTIALYTQNLNVRDGGRINAETFGQGDAGQIQIVATGSANFDGSSRNFFRDESDLPSAASITVRPGAIGNGGSLKLEAQSLNLTNGARLLAGTLGTGSSGNIQIQVHDRALIAGNNSGAFSGILATAGSGAIGDGGTISLAARSLQLDRGAFILSSAIIGSTGNAGNINLTADQITLDNSGGTLAVPDLGNSIGGLPDVGINGISSNGLLPTGIFSSTQSGVIGNSGTITLNANQITARQGAVISVSNLGFGGAGEINLFADQINLDQAKFTANTLGFSPRANQDLANINLQTSALILENQSSITSNAAGFSNGGNLNLNTGVLVAIQNSDITANAIASLGGRVVVNTQGIFGTEFRDRLTSVSDITATSELGAEFDGIVEFQTPEIDTTSGLVRLESTPIDVTSLVDQNPCLHRDTNEQQSQFISTGRGGLPPIPDQPRLNLPANLPWLDLAEAHATSIGSIDPNASINPNAPIDNALNIPITTTTAAATPLPNDDKIQTQTCWQAVTHDRESD